MSDEPRLPSSEHEETRAMHASPSTEGAADVTGSPAGADLAGMPAEVDGYRLLGVLGQGGMGVVYLAEQREPRESDVRRRLAALDALVDLERAWGTRAPSAARAAALKRWTAARDAEAPELKAAIEEGRAPRGSGAR